MLQPLCVTIDRLLADQDKANYSAFPQLCVDNALFHAPTDYRKGTGNELEAKDQRAARLLKFYCLIDLSM